jgi:CheY-like chemotaxis protein
MANRKILIVDDDVDFLDSLRIQFEVNGDEVISAHDTQEAMEMLEQSKPDAAIVDLMMENMDAGFTLCRDIKNKYSSIPVIMVTAVASETGLDFDASTEEERSWIKADALLAKPVRFEQLLTEIEKHQKDHN